MKKKLTIFLWSLMSSLSFDLTSCIPDNRDEDDPYHQKINLDESPTQEVAKDSLKKENYIESDSEIIMIEADMPDSLR